MTMDTSRANVEALAERMETDGRVYTHMEAAALLRALLAERDAAASDAKWLKITLRDMHDSYDHANALRIAAQAERDALRARAERAEAALAGTRRRVVEISEMHSEDVGPAVCALARECEDAQRGEGEG